MAFYQDFRSQPSRIHLHVSAQLTNHDSKQVIATKDFNINQPATCRYTVMVVWLQANQVSGSLLPCFILSQWSCIAQSYPLPNNAVIAEQPV